MIIPGTTIEIRKPSLRFVFTDSFGNQTDISKDLRADGIDDLFGAIREALAGCGFSEGTINQWFPVD